MARRMSVRDGGPVMSEADYKAQDEFIDACNRMDVEAIEAYMKLKKTLNIQDESWDTPLHKVARRGETALCKKMIQQGADPNAKDKAGNTPLMAAIEYSRKDTMIMMLDNRGDLDVVNNQGYGLLHHAAYVGDVPQIEHLLKIMAAAGVVADKVNEQEASGRTPLHIASYRAGANAVQAFLDAGADAKIKDKRGNNAGALAKNIGRRGSAELLEAQVKAMKGVQAAVRITQAGAAASAAATTSS